MEWLLAPADNLADPGEQYWPEPWKGPTGQGKCGACGRFVTKGGSCSLVLPTYRAGSYYGLEHR
jgi:hypothetical protein